MTSVDVMTLVVDVVFVLASLAALRLWVRHRRPSTAWLLATFVVFGVAVVTSWLPSAPFDTGLPQRLLTAALVVTPLLLYRFADAVVGGHPTPRRVGDIATIAIVLATLALPELPGEQTADMSPPQLVWFVGVLVTWAALDVGAGALLVRASIGEPGIVRRRLRLLAVAAIGLGLHIPVVAAIAAEPGTGADLLGRVVTATLGMLFLVGFAPPRLLRAAWRDEDERRLSEAAVGLMVARTEDDVAAVLVGQVRELLGAPSVTMRAPDDRVLATTGSAPVAPGQVRALRHHQIGEHHLEMVESTRMPIFGSDEGRTLDRLALLAGLALDRVRLLAEERTTRDTVERLNEELEAFVYSTSHDLKNPVIALSGYLDVLVEDFGAELPEPVQQVLARMRVNVRHVDALIHDLLALSRVGRVDVLPDRVDLEVLVDDLAADLRARAPDATVTRTSLPTLWINGTRARQVMSNLLDNAVAYGGRPDVTINVSAAERTAGVRIVVADDGRGVPEPYLERIFGVFERLDPELGSGTGMGLAICRRVIELVGGRMYAVPSSAGAVIHIDLPGSVVADPLPEPELQGSTR